MVNNKNYELNLCPVGDDDFGLTIYQNESAMSLDFLLEQNLNVIKWNWKDPRTNYFNIGDFYFRLIPEPIFVYYPAEQKGMITFQFAFQKTKYVVNSLCNCDSDILSTKLIVAKLYCDTINAIIITNPLISLCEKPFTYSLDENNNLEITTKCLINKIDENN